MIRAQLIFELTKINVKTKALQKEELKNKSSAIGFIIPDEDDCEEDDEDDDYP